MGFFSGILADVPEVDPDPTKAELGIRTSGSSEPIQRRFEAGANAVVVPLILADHDPT